MKINPVFTTLLEKAAQTTLDTLANSSPAQGQKTPAGSTKGGSPSAAPAPQPEEPVSQTFKGIGTQIASAVTEGLSKQIDKKVQETVSVGESAIDRQRQIALREMQNILAGERTKAMEELRKTATSFSNKVLLSAAFVGGSLLFVAAALFLHK